MNIILVWTKRSKNNCFVVQDQYTELKDFFIEEEVREGPGRRREGEICGQGWGKQASWRSEEKIEVKEIGGGVRRRFRGRR